MITAFGVLALTFMMTMYALEDRGRGFVLAFALGCELSAACGFLAGAWPFGVVELICGDRGSSPMANPSGTVTPSAGSRSRLNHPPIGGGGR
jgi:hypothetical protein